MSEPLNPWLSRPTTPPPTQAAPVASVPDAFGPVAPQRGILPRIASTSSRSTTAARPPRSGGWGARRLGRVDAGSSHAGVTAAGHAWPRTPFRRPRGRCSSHAVTLGDCAPRRTRCVSGRRASCPRLKSWAWSSWLTHLVVPRSLRDLLQVVSGGVPRTWTVPWVEAWRGEPPALASSPREVQRLVDELTALLGAAGTTN
jgi:hypothetical protein